jgi:hypothetical protein
MKIMDLKMMKRKKMMKMKMNIKKSKSQKLRPLIVTTFKARTNNSNAMTMEQMTKKKRE